MGVLSLRVWLLPHVPAKYLGTQFRKEPITRQDLASLDADVVQLVPEEVARQYGMITLRQCGFRQAARGLTTLEEVLTVATGAE